MWLTIIAGLLFSALMVGTSYGVNRRLLGQRLEIDAYRLILSATAVLFLAVTGESFVNSVYQLGVGTKLWEYRVHPLHDKNVSALAVFLWTAYGVHLYFTRQSMNHLFSRKWNNRLGKSLVLCLEAPLVFEVCGNLFFLLLLKQYYAYYLPGDLFHLTSIQVIPVYLLCIYFGLVILGILEKLPRRREIPLLLGFAGTAWLLAG